MSNTDVSEELAEKANTAFSIAMGAPPEPITPFRECLRAAIKAIAPRLRAEGMREAAERARSHRLGILQLAADLESRADALEKETKL